MRDQEYFWVASGNDGYIDLRAMAIEGGQLLACTFGYHHRETPRSDGHTSLKQQFVVTPYIVRQVIEYGLTHDWKPLECGPEMSLGSLDDKIDLRLEVNREETIREGTS